MAAAPPKPLGDLRAADGAAFGGKSAGPGELLHAGIAVPPGLALPAVAFTEFVAGAGLEGVIVETLAGAGEGLEGTAAAAPRIGDAIRVAKMPTALASEVTARCAGLAPGDSPVAVRSSALGEDSAEAISYRRRLKESVPAMGGSAVPRPSSAMALVMGTFGDDRQKG